jgi:hypothetical protein
VRGRDDAVDPGAGDAAFRELLRICLKMFIVISSHVRCPAVSTPLLALTVNSVKANPHTMAAS